MREDCTIEPVSHSIPAPASVAQFVHKQWDAGTILSCSLLRSYANDVFRVSTSRGEWIAKIYRRGWRDVTDAKWEADLCQHIIRKGVLVALPEIGCDGQAVQIMTLPEGERAVLLTPWLPGAKPKAPAEPEFYVDFGRAAAHLHLTTMDFRSAMPERMLDGDYLVRQPMSRLQSSPVFQTPVFAALPQIAIKAAAAIDRRMPALPSGICHGDLTLDNLHLLPDGEMGFYDFDLAGRGPFAFDFGLYHGWVQQDATAAPKWQAFQHGYSEVRPIAPEERAAAAWFNLGYQIWDMEHTIHNWAAWSGTWRATESIIQNMLTTIYDSAAPLLQNPGEQ